MTRANSTIDNQILLRILKLMETKGVRQKDLAEYLGITDSSLTQWKSNRTRSYMNYLDKIATYLNVDREYLLHGNGEEFTDDFSLSKKERQLVNQIRMLEKPQQDNIYKVVNLFIDSCATGKSKR
jgi:transcriptional regulator with XRE-family HTH domain